MLPQQIRPQLFPQLGGRGLEAVRQVLGDQPIVGALLEDGSLELVLQGAAVTGGGRVLEIGRLRVFQESRDAAALLQHAPVLLQLCGVDLAVQALFVAPEGIHRGPGGDQLPIDVLLRGGAPAAEVLFLELVLQDLGARPGVGHVGLRNVRGDLAQMQNVVLELVLQRAAVTGQRGLPDRAGVVLEEILEGLAVLQAVGDLRGLFGVHVGLQRLLLVPLRIHGTAGCHELGIVLRLRVVVETQEARILDLVLQALDPLLGGWHVVLRHLGGELLHLADVVLELLLQLAAVAGSGELFHLPGILVEKALEGRAVRQLRGVVVHLFGIDLVLQGLLFIPLRVDAPAGGKDLGVKYFFIVRLQELILLELLLEGLNALVGVGDHLFRQVLGQIFLILDVLLELVHQRAAVAGGRTLLGLVVVGDVVPEGLAGVPLFPGLLQGLGVNDLVQAVLLAPDGPHRFAGGHELHKGRGPVPLLREVVFPDLLLQGLGPLQGLGHIAGGGVPGDHRHAPNVVLEGILQRAAVARQGRVLDDGGLAGIRDKGLEGVAFRQLLPLRLQLCGVRLGLQAALLAADRVHGAAGRHQLGIELLILRRAAAALPDLLLQGLGADLGRGHEFGRNVGLQLVPAHQVLRKLVAQRAAVTGDGAVVDLGPLVFDKILEGLAVAPLLAALLELLGVDLLFQARLLAPLGAHRVAGAHDLGGQGQLPLVGAVEVVHVLEFRLNGLQTVLGLRHTLLRHVRRDVVQVLHMLLELVAQGAAVALEQGLSGLRVMLPQIALEGFAALPFGIGLLQGGGIDRRFQAGLFPPDGAHALPGRHQLVIDDVALFEIRGVLHLLLEGLAALLGLGRVGHRHVGGDALQIQDVVLEQVLPRAAVALAGGEGRLQLRSLFLHEALEGGAAAQIRGLGIGIRLDLRLQGRGLAPCRAHCLTGAEDLRVDRRGLLGPGVHALQLLLLLLDPILGLGHIADRHVGGQLVLLQDIVLKTILRRAAVPRGQHHLHFGVALRLHKALEALTLCQAVLRRLHLFGVHRDLQRSLFLANRIAGCAKGKDIGVHLQFSILADSVKLRCLHGLLHGIDGFQRAFTIYFVIDWHNEDPFCSQAGEGVALRFSAGAKRGESFVFLRIV